TNALPACSLSLRRGTIPGLMRIALDTGGTFTDCIYLRGGRIEILKVPSTPRDPAQAILDALGRIAPVGIDQKDLQFDLDLLCGTTVGTNALLQRKGGRVALVTTAEFEDVLEIGRQARTSLYNLFVEKTPPLVPRTLRFGLAERLDSEGRVLRTPSAREFARIVREVIRSKAESVAVCFLFSFANPKHEKAMARALTSAGFPVSASFRILPEHREFERTSTTAVNAFLVPVMSSYLSGIERGAGPAFRAGVRPPRHSGRRKGGVRVRVMQSNGGIISAQAAAREPVRTILSGPAGGVLGAQYAAALAGFDRVITFDMGGTSTDVSLLHAGQSSALATTSETIVSGVPVGVPMLDIHTVGAGGGSVARYDRAGALRVGPESAGADPGPICYGRGTKPTVTDANLILGRIPTDGLLGGAFELDARRAREYLDRERGPMRSAEQFAQGIVDVANAVMGKAIRVISVERGHDPRDYTLVAFGGAGPLHACDLAEELEIPRVLVPCLPGGLSALGILRADVAKDLSRTILRETPTARKSRPSLVQEFKKLEHGGLRQMRAEGYPAHAVEIDRTLEMRYSGQSYELMVPFSGDYVAAFHRAHERRYGYCDRARPCEVVNVRARFTGSASQFSLPIITRGNRECRRAIASSTRAWFAGRMAATPVYRRKKLLAGNSIPGPAVVSEYSSTTLIPPGWAARVDLYGNLVLERRQ
ncbi:MAG: hydantoinase/oxoprolinase family protein, partial [Candidatus Acidiferrales bacterium]